MSREKIRSKYGMSLEQPAAEIVTDKKLSPDGMELRTSTPRLSPVSRGRQFVIPGLFEADPNIVKIGKYLEDRAQDPDDQEKGR